MPTIFAVKDGDDPNGHGFVVPGGVLYTSFSDLTEAVGGTDKEWKEFHRREKAKDWLFDEPYPIGTSTNGHDGPLCFVDGSANTSRNKAAWACVVFEGDQFVRARNGAFSVRSRHSTAAEIRAASEAIEMGYDYGEEYVIVCDFHGIIRYAQGDWPTGDDPYVEVFLHKLNEKGEDVVAGFRKVEGHTGVRGNEIADVLAGNARRLAEHDIFHPPTIE